MMTTLMNIIMNLFRLLEDSITFPLNIFDTILVNKSYTEGNFAYALNSKNEHISEADLRNKSNN